MQSKSGIIAALFVAALAALPATSAHALRSAPPQTINYQGTLATAGKTPVTGTVSMTFSIYNGNTGGTALWTETQSVSVSKGAYSVLLGSVTPIPLPFNAPYFLGVTVGTDSEMTPRLALTSSPYAFNVVNGAITDSGISASAAIADSKLAQITTPGKVTGAALTSLSTLPSGAGAVPVANGGTGATTLTGYVLSNGTSAMTASATIPATAISGALPAAQLPAMVGDSGSGGTKGAAPAPSAGDAAAGKFLKADGTWAIPASGGGGSFVQTYIVPFMTGGTVYLTGSGYNSTEAAQHRLIPIACTSGTMYAALSYPVSGSQSVTLTVRKGTPPNFGVSASNTTITCTLSQSQQSCSSTDAVSFAAGDSMAVQLANAGVSTSVMVAFTCH